MFEIINNYDGVFDDIEFLEGYIMFVCSREGILDAIFNIIFVNDEEIHRINFEYRGVDRVTDVISFALEDVDDVSAVRVLGDIYIALDVAKRQALEYGHSLRREVCFLVTHGILHLLGYDHMKKEDEEVMFGIQEELLSEYGINR